MPLFALTIAISALLLFLVQPIIAKQILPWFGGSAGVWSVCMVFFQTALLAGYGYAHFVVRRLAPRNQARLHIALLAGSLLVLPIIPGAHLRPRGGEDAPMAILLVLLLTIGLPYFLLSTTGPLLQAWVAHRFAARSVYRMFALSNLGSLAGLVAFPFVVEPLLDSRTQAVAWSALYAVFVAGCAWTAWRSRHGSLVESAAEPTTGSAADSPTGQPPAPAVAHPAGGPLSWLALSALGVVLLLATTNQLLQNVASAPFLWILPLALYLLSFVVVFEGRGGRGWYDPRWGVPAALLAAALMAVALSASNGLLDPGVSIPLYCGGLFFACIFCHGELAARKPESSSLTQYYLMLSLGGAIGGIFVGLVAPLVFPSLYELPLALLAVALATIASVARRPGLRRAWSWVLGILAIATAGLVGWEDLAYVRALHHDLIVQERNFYGTLRVREVEEDGIRVRRLLHGVILHGEQAMSGEDRNRPGTYYVPTSGVGLAIARVQQQAASVRVGVIGLGVGTIAGYGRAGDLVHFYEIDPDVVAIARSRFTYLESTPATVEVTLGDARLSLERELAERRAQGFDVLAVDAFSSDSIPVHLLTREAVLLYVDHLAPGGILAVHISNRFLELEPVLGNILAATGLHGRLIDDDPPDSEPRASGSRWVLIARDEATLSEGAIGKRGTVLAVRPGARVWTDGYNNLLGVMRSSPLSAIESLIEKIRGS